jgi:hypothetical protein
MTVPEATIAAYLASGGFGTLGSDIFYNQKPATPDALICVFGYAGQAPERTHDDSGNSRPGIQVWVRGTAGTAATTRTKIENIFNYLDGVSNTTISSTFFLSIRANQSPEPMGTDENGRPEFAVNFSTIIRR